MNKELYVFRCLDCNLDFRTDDPNQRVCPTCQIYRKPNQTPRKKHKYKPPTIYEILRIANIYGKIKGKYIQYGDMVKIISQTKRGHCVCCGAEAPENKLICDECERRATINGNT